MTQQSVLNSKHGAGAFLIFLRAENSFIAWPFAKTWSWALIPRKRGKVNRRLLKGFIEFSQG